MLSTFSPLSLNSLATFLATCVGNLTPSPHSFQPRRYKQHVPLKHRYPPKSLHNITAQNTSIWSWPHNLQSNNNTQIPAEPPYKTTFLNKYHQTNFVFMFYTKSAITFKCPALWSNVKLQWEVMLKTGTSSGNLSDQPKNYQDSENFL